MAETVAETEAGTVATLHALKARHIRAVVESDIAWYANRLTAHFVGALGNPPSTRRSPARLAAARTPSW
jgi:hypothetical protein